MIDNRLKKLRNELNLTQRELSEKLNVSKGSIAMYETGKRSPDNDFLSKLADFFDVSTDYLLGRTDIRKYNAEFLEFYVTDGLTQSDLDLVYKLIENLKEKNKANK